MKINYKALELFPTPLVIMDIEEDTDALLNCKEFELSTVDADKLNHKNNPLGQRILEQYPAIRDLFINKFKEVMKQYMNYFDKEYMITTSWITHTAEGGQAQAHLHRNSFWSGVYYFDKDYPKGTADIQFQIERLGDYYFSSLDIKNYTPINTDAWTISPKPKRLLLFPSHLQHQIEVQTSNTIRKSLAFNIVPISRYGSFDSSYDIDWGKAA